MKITKLVLPVTFCLLMSGCMNNACSLKKGESIIAEGAQLKEISTEFIFTEGPATDQHGNVYFTNQDDNRIMVYKTDGTLETFMQPAGRANGMYFDHNGYLLACADENSELWKIDVNTKEHSVIASTYNGKRLNSVNDLWVRPDGGIYFSDPYYQRTWWEHNAPTQDGEHVYFLTPDYKKLIRVTEDLIQPNGLIGTPDGKHLYITDFKAKITYKYDIEMDGTLTNKTLFCEFYSDGMTIDCCGNVYLTNRQSVLVFDPKGKLIEEIITPQPTAANVTFGGPDKKMLFITATKGVYTINMNVSGVQW